MSIIIIYIMRKTLPNKLVVEAKIQQKIEYDTFYR